MDNLEKYQEQGTCGAFMRLENDSHGGGFITPVISGQSDGRMRDVQKFVNIALAEAREGVKEEKICMVCSICQLVRRTGWTLGGSSFNTGKKLRCELF